MKLPHDPNFNEQFDLIPELVWYPYVGRRFKECSQRLMVYAHNAYMDQATYDLRRLDFEQKLAWADCVEEYTYEQAWYTKAFRAFVKGAVGLSQNYGYHSEPEVIEKVDAFVERIAYLNFIQGLVLSDRALTVATDEVVEKSKRINKRIVETLGITHCICWGGPTFEYLAGIDGYRILKDENFQCAGFGYRLLECDGSRRMHALKVFHPSMPSFRAYSPETQAILREFLAKPYPVARAENSTSAPEI